MASFELRSSNSDGHIRALSKAIQMASKISKDALLEFTQEKLRLCAKTDLFLVKFVFNKEFFTSYSCDRRHRCYVNLKALSLPFKSSILMSERDGCFRSQIGIKCLVEDELHNQIVFKIGSDPPTATLTYKLGINDMDPDRMAELSAINRTIDYRRVEMSPKQSKKDRFLLSAFNSFAPDIDQVTIKTSQSEVKFIGSISPLVSSGHGNNYATSEFTHKRDDFMNYVVKEDLTITIPLRYLKLFLTFVETNKVQTFPKYIFEGVGLPAHFIYDAHLFKGHFVSATPYEYLPEELHLEERLPIAYGPGANESFIGDDNYHQNMETNIEDDELGGAYDQYAGNDDEIDIDDDEEDGYNDNRSDCSDLLDGNLEGLNSTVNGSYHSHQASGLNTSFHNTTVFGNESIRSEMGEFTYDPEKIKDLVNIDQDPDEIENVAIQYSSDEDED